MAAPVVARAAVLMLSSDAARVVAGAVGAMVVGLATIVFLIVALLSSLVGFAGGIPSLGLLPPAGVAPGPLAARVPAEQLDMMQRVAAGSACGLPWSVLAGVASVESEFGRNLGPSSAGAYGYGQFMPGTWAAYGGGVPWRTTDPAQLALLPSERFDSSNYHHALPAMSAYLCAMVAAYGTTMSPQEALKRALFYYNHALAVPYDPEDGYVSRVLGFAVRAGAGAGGPVAGRPVGGHPWSIAFGFQQAYGAAQFSAAVPIHRGVDLVIPGASANGRGRPFLAFYPGVVAAITRDPFGGHGIVVWDAFNGLYHRYFHSDTVLVSAGQPVDTTTAIGILGASGTEGFPHVHYEVSRAIHGDPVCCLVDPRPFLRGEVPLP
jgi:peptidoglycan LD-endopeptidase LytH